MRLGFNPGLGIGRWVSPGMNSEMKAPVRCTDWKANWFHLLSSIYLLSSNYLRVSALNRGFRAIHPP